MSRETETLSRREARAVQGIASGLSAQDALIRAGYSESVARTRSKDVLLKPRIQKILKEAMEETGINSEFLALTIRRGLSAKKNIYHEGRLVAQEPDHGTRHKFAKTALQLRGDLERDASEQGDTWEAAIFRIRGQRASAEGSSP